MSVGRSTTVPVVVAVAEVLVAVETTPVVTLLPVRHWTPRWDPELSWHVGSLVTGHPPR